MGSETKTVICLVTILPRPGLGRNGGQAFCLSFLQAAPASYHVLRQGMDEDGGCGEENVDLPGSQDLSERGLRGGGGGR